MSDSRLTLISCRSVRRYPITGTPEVFNWNAHRWAREESPARRRVPPARHGVLRVPFSPRGGKGGGEAVEGQAARPPAPMEGGFRRLECCGGAGGSQGPPVPGSAA